MATTDYELCIELYEWWSEIWTLENGSFPHSSHNFWLDGVHHFPIEIRTNEFAELINVGRLQAQSWCLKHGHKWCNANVAGFDFHGQPATFTFSSANTCMLSQVPWVTSPYAELTTLLTNRSRTSTRTTTPRTCTPASPHVQQP